MSRALRNRNFSGIALGTLLMVGAARPAPAHDDIDTENAKRHFNQGRTLYDAGSYERAAEEFQRALIAMPLPAFHYNLAKAYDRLERYEDAIREYATYLRTGPDLNDITDVKVRISQLEAKRALTAELPVLTQPIAAPGRTGEPRAGSERAHRWLWPLLGGGAAAIVAGVVTAIVLVATATNYTDQARSNCPNCPVFP